MSILLYYLLLQRDKIILLIKIVFGSEGFLISNYQTEIPEYFIPGEDIVLYDSPESLMQLADYYLRHDNERREIAHNAFVKTKENHTYVKRIELMLESL